MAAEFDGSKDHTHEGVIEDVVLHYICLDADEINRVYLDGNRLSIPKDGDIFEDRSGHGHHGIISSS